MAMIVFMAMAIAMPWACYGHAMSVIINMVMEMSWRCHGHGHVMAMASLVGKAMISDKHIAKAISLAKFMALSRMKILDKIMKFSRS